jgi:hypothetical protein
LIKAIEGIDDYVDRTACIVFWEMEVDQSPFSLALGDELDNRLYLVPDLMTLSFIGNLNVFIAEKQIVVDAIFISADCSNYVCVF